MPYVAKKVEIKKKLCLYPNAQVKLSWLPHIVTSSMLNMCFFFFFNYTLFRLLLTLIHKDHGCSIF
jgi:hypothetical protein